jgi:hypothetical protein
MAKELIPSSATGLSLPVAVVGFEGIYDMRGLNDRYNDEYREFICAAFGADEEAWDKASPGRFKLKFGQEWQCEGEAETGISGKKVVVLAQSPQDQLIDMAEMDTMETRLREEENDGKLSILAYRDLEGSHDGVPEDGTFISRVLYQAMDELDRLKEAPTQA